MRTTSAPRSRTHGRSPTRDATKMTGKLMRSILATLPAYRPVLSASPAPPHELFPVICRLADAERAEERQRGGRAGAGQLPSTPKDGGARIARFHGDAARCVIERLAGMNAALGNAASVARIRNTPNDLGIAAELTLGNGYPAATVQRTSSPTNGREYEAGPWTAWAPLSVWRRAINALGTHGAARHACNDFDVVETIDENVMLLQNAGMWDGDPGRGGVTVAIATERR